MFSRDSESSAHIEKFDASESSDDESVLTKSDTVELTFPESKGGIFKLFSLHKKKVALAMIISVLKAGEEMYFLVSLS